MVMAALRNRMADQSRHANIRYTQAIVNQGREAGASLSHPHGQLLGMPFVPGEIVDEERAFARFDGGCILCVTAEAELADGSQGRDGQRRRRGGVPLLERHALRDAHHPDPPRRPTCTTPPRPTWPP